MLFFGFRYLAFFLFITSLLSFMNIIYSYYFNFFLNLNNYIFTLFLSLILGSIFFLKKKKNTDFKINIYGKILTVLSGYILIPLIFSLPFYLSVYNFTLLDSFFESISGFTSTGFSIIENIKNYDESLIIWRSTTQWIGGLYFLFSIVLLIDIFDDNLKKSLTNFLSFNTSETVKQSIKIFLMYTVLTVILFLIFNIFEFRSFISLNLSLTFISSGGFLPVNSFSNIATTNLKELVLAFSMLISFFSIFLSYNLFFKKNRSLNFFQEDIYLLIYLIFLIAVFFIFLNFENDFSRILLLISSCISNIGVSLNDTPENLSLIFLILVIIGGSFFSTSSGIRFLKLFAMFRFSINNLISHAKPKNIYVDKHFIFEISYKKHEINKYFLSILIFIISIFILSSLLTLSNIHFENAIKLSVLTLMNTVNSSMYGLGDLNFGEMSIITKYYLIFFMIIGRVELLTLLIILKKFLFKN